MGKTNKFIERIVLAFLQELPFIITFCVLMGSFGIVSRILLFLRTDNTQGMIMPAVYLRYLFIWFFFAYTFALCINTIKQKSVKTGLLCICFLFFIIQDFLVQHFNTNISPQYLTLVVETNKNEINDFFHLFVFSKKTFATLARATFLLLLYFILEYLNKRFIKDKHFEKKHLLSTVLVLLIVPSILYGCICTFRIYSRIHNDLTEDITFEESVPTDPFSRLYYSASFLKKYGAQTKKAIEVSLNAKGPSKSSEADRTINLVVVIGESYNKYHSSLYGYELCTTPHLLREKQNGNLFVFKDVTAPANLTSIVIKNLLSTNALGYKEQWYDFPVFPSVFKQNGYSVFFWDNQKSFGGNSTFSYSLNSFLYNPSIREISYSFNNNQTFPYDYELVDDLLASIPNNGSNGSNLFILHLMGQHMKFRERFPSGETWFSIDSVKRKDSFLTAEKKQLIADYDNATKYNDLVMNHLFSYFRSTNTILVYFSDHGEEIYDYRDHIYRDQGVLTPDKLKYQYEVPFMIWCSDKYIQDNQDIVASITKATDLPYSLDLLPNLLFKLGDIDTPYYRQELDILNVHYHCPTRVVGSDQSYDSIIAASNNSNKP